MPSKRRGRSHVRRPRAVATPQIQRRGMARSVHVPRARTRVPSQRVPRGLGAAVSSGPRRVKCYFLNEPNYGDQLSLVVLRGLVNRFQLRLEVDLWSDVATADVVGIGSVATAIPSAYSGYIWTTGVVSAGFSRAVPQARVVAVRGQSSARALHRDPATTVLGDGGLLLPWVVPPPTPPAVATYRLGIIPHVVDYATVAPAFCNQSGVLLINLREPVPVVTAQIRSCECVISSSLHGLIVADAFGIPNVHVVVPPSKLIGGRHKFEDYYSAFAMPCPAPLVFDPTRPAEAYVAHIRTTYARPGLLALQERLLHVTRSMLQSLSQ